MAELATVARPYAEALFRVAKNGDLSAWADLMTEMAQVAAHPDVKMMVENPALSSSQVIDTYISLLKSEVNAEASNFIEILVKNDRVSLLPIIAVQFHELINADSGSADAHIETAYDMPESQISDLLRTLDKKFGRKLNVASVTVDSSLIGGVRVTVSDEVLDLSVRAKLQQMHAALVS